MRQTLVIFSLLFAAHLTGFSAGLDKPKIIRDWKSADGRQLKAELLDFDSKEIKIKRMTDFQIMKVPVDKFSAEDQAFVAGLVYERSLDEGITKGPYAEKITGAFVKAVSKQGLNYQIYGDPKWDGTQRYPLVIWLHGSGQSGSDNEAQMGGPTGIFTNAEHQTANPCFMIAPQCPDADIGWNKQVADNLMALIADLTSKLPIDLKRLYLTGSSMGGFGTWSLCAKYPNVFAAGVPLCGGGDSKKADVLKNVPMWVFHGDQDPMVPVERDRVPVEAVKAAGGLVMKYTEFPGVGHSLSGLVYPMPELHRWLFEQRLAPVKDGGKAE